MMRERLKEPVRVSASGGFVCGRDRDGTCGDVEIDFFCNPLEPENSFEVRWGAPPCCVPEDGRTRIMMTAEAFLRSYLSRNDVGLLKVIIVNAGWSQERINEPERATGNAIHMAIIRAHLPPVILYCPPDEDPSWTGAVAQ